MAKVKVPKRIAGVKVPKKLRKQVKRALVLTDSPAVRDLAIAGLTLAAETLIDRAQSRQLAKAGAREALDEAGEGQGDRAGVAKPNLDALQLGEVLRAAAVEGARRFLEGFQDGERARNGGSAPDRPRRTRVSAPKAAAADE